MILYVRTDSPVALIGLSDGEQTLVEQQLELGRAMARDLPAAVEALLADRDAGWASLDGLVVFRGPGSFTGLRIGCTLMNALAYSLELPIVGTKDDAWVAEGVARLSTGEDDKVIVPHYGADARITKPRK